MHFTGDTEDQCYGESGDELVSIDGGNGGGRSYRKGTHPPDLLAFPRGGGGGGHSSPASSIVSTIPSFQSPLHSPIYSGTLPYNRSQSPFSSRSAQAPAGYVTIPRRPRVPSWAGNAAASTPTGHLDDPLGVGRPCEPVYDNLGPRTTADGSSVLSLTKAVLADAGVAVHRPTPQYSQTLPHKTKLHGGVGGGNVMQHPPRFNAAPACGSRVPSPAPRSPDKTPSNAAAVHNALPPNYSPLVELVDSRNRSSWAPSRVGTPETGVLKPASQTSVKRKVPPKPPPKPKMKGGPLFEDEGEDGTEV